MKARWASVLVMVLAFCSAAAMAQQQGGGVPQGRGGRGMGMGPMGRGIGGTVTAVNADSLTVKTEQGETYTVHFSANTRIVKQAPRPAGAANNAPNDNQGAARGDGQGRMRMDPPVAIKISDIHVGDAVMAGGEVDDAGKSVGAVMIMQLDPERAKQMREMEANFGKTWLMGKVTAVNETKVTLDSNNIDKSTHTFVADENTTFRKRRDPITLADVQVGDMVRVEGAVKGGTFVATSVSVMGQPGGQRPQGAQPQQ